MQEPVDKNLQISILLGKTIENLRINKKKLSLNKFANEYEIGKTSSLIFFLLIKKEYFLRK